MSWVLLLIAFTFLKHSKFPGKTDGGDQISENSSSLEIPYTLSYVKTHIRNEMLRASAAGYPVWNIWSRRFRSIQNSRSEANAS